MIVAGESRKHETGMFFDYSAHGGGVLEGTVGDPRGVSPGKGRANALPCWTAGSAVETVVDKDDGPLPRGEGGVELCREEGQLWGGEVGFVPAVGGGCVCVGGGGEEDNERGREGVRGGM